MYLVHHSEGNSAPPTSYLGDLFMIIELDINPSKKSNRDCRNRQAKLEIFHKPDLLACVFCLSDIIKKFYCC